MAGVLWQLTLTCIYIVVLSEATVTSRAQVYTNFTPNLHQLAELDWS